MRLVYLVGIGALAVASVAPPVLSANATAPIYLLTMQMKDGNRLVGSPSLKIIAGQPARIEVGNEPGDHYSISITATPQSGDTVAIASIIDVVSAGRHYAESPTLRVGLGRPSAIEVGEESPTSKPFRVDFTIDRTT